MDFYWELINTEHLDGEVRAQIEDAIFKHAYICQGRIEQEFDPDNPQASVGDSCNVVMEAEDEAYVVEVEVEDNDVMFVLDCSKVVL